MRIYQLYSYPLIISSSFNKIILQFYKQQSERKSLVVNFIPALPVLHFLQGESKPFKDLACEKTVNVGNLKWWGLDEFRLSEIRKNIKDRFVTLFLCFLHYFIILRIRNIKDFIFFCFNLSF